MAMQSGVQVQSIKESIRFDVAGRAVRIDVITYTVGQDGPFTLDVAPENNSQAWIEGQLAAKAASIAALRAGS